MAEEPINLESARKVRRLRQVKNVWQKLVKEGKEGRKEFDRMAEDSKKFFAGRHEHVFDRQKLDLDWDEWPKVTINLVWELVRIIGPALYHQNPTRTVSTRSDKYAKRVFSKVLEALLNYSAYETHLKRHARRAIVSAILNGLGILWPYLDEDRGLIASEFVDYRDFIIDPDARSMDEARWIARKRTDPIWLLQELFPDAKDKLARKESMEAQREHQSIQTNSYTPYEYDDDPSEVDHESLKGSTNYQMTYWEIYSRMGDGLRSMWATPGWKDADIDQPDERYIVLAEDLDEPLHVGDWPNPLYLDGDWPCTILTFVENPDTAWPLPYIRGAQGEQEGMDIIMSMMMNKAKNLSKDVVAVASHLDEEVKTTIVEGGDLSVVEVDFDNQYDDINKLIQFLQAPDMSNMLPAMFDRLMELFRERTGMNEILYGQTPTQLRSAREAEIKDRNSRVHIEDMQEQVSDWSSMLARKEAIMARFLLDEEEVRQAVGDTVFAYAVEISAGGQRLPLEAASGVHTKAGDYLDSMEEAQAVSQEIMMGQSNLGMGVGIFTAKAVEVTADIVWRDFGHTTPEAIVREYDVRIEQSSSRRPDRNFQIDQAESMLNEIGPIFIQVGDLENFNKILEFVYETRMIPREYRVYPTTPPPPQALPPAAGGGGGLPTPQQEATATPEQMLRQMASSPQEQAIG